MLRKINKAKAGFTLIELLVVIAIIGVLASIVLASLNTARQKARDAKRIGDVRQIQLALELYADSTKQQYPTANSTACDGNTNMFGLTVLRPTYMSVIPVDPNRSGVDACYKYASQPTTLSWYHLGAFMEQKGQVANMDKDRDCDSGAVDGCATGASAGAGIGFRGLSTNCGAGTAATTDEQCYDVTN